MRRLPPLLLTLATLISGAAPSLACPGVELDETLPGGGRWQLCFEVRAEAGPVLSDVRYGAPGETPRRVLAELGIAGLSVLDGRTGEIVGVAPDPGLGLRLRTLDPADCTGGARLGLGGRDVACLRTEPLGYAHKYYGSEQQHYALVLTSTAAHGNRSWQLRHRLHGNGTLEPGYAITGKVAGRSSDPETGWPLDAEGEVGVATLHEAVFRFAFDLAGDGQHDVVEEIEFAPEDGNARLALQRRALAEEEAREIAPAAMRFWRVLDEATLNADGHPISYQLDPLPIRQRRVPFEVASGADLYVTRARACERFARQNPALGQRCPATVDEMVDGETLDGGAVVLWFRLATAHVPRSEDEPFVNAGFQSVQLVPRDWTHRNPL